MFSTLQAAHDRLDILFANAGGGEFSPLGAITEAQFDKYFGINVKGTLFTVQNALPLMRPGSAIVITGSIAGSKGMPANRRVVIRKAGFFRPFLHVKRQRATRIQKNIPIRIKRIGGVYPINASA
jgi:NAD(P)-dependent dehydrogenase (short-subunit alcohol dehydrogenase family)